MKQQEPLQHVIHLAQKIGCRPIGSPQNHEAADYITQHFQDYGFLVESQDFDCPYWQADSVCLELGEEALEASVNTFSPSCDVRALTLSIGTFAELQVAVITGRILLFYGAMSQFELAAKGAIYVSDRDQETIRLLETGRPSAIITVNPCLNCRWRLIEDFDLDIPSITVPAASGLKLLQRQGEEVHVQIVTRRFPSHSANIVARLPGERPERIVLLAHYDTKIDTPGAYDNAAGIGVLLTLAQQLSNASLTHSLEMIAISGEEIYGLGDMEYARRIKNEFGQILFAMNFDGVGPRLASNTVAIFSASQPMEVLVNELAQGYPGVQKVDPWPYSDHYLFYSHGVPSLAMSSLGIRDIFHTPADTIEWISQEKLVEAVHLAVDIVGALDQKELSWCRPE